MAKAARLLPLLLCGGALAVLLPYAARPLWFDEALTVLQFAVLPSAGAIYHAYVIPNNQIIHTVLVRFFLENAPSGISLVFWLRLLPVLAGAGTVLILFCRFRRVCGVWPLTAVLTAWILSPAFVIFGTALRGYMLSCLWIALALAAALDFAEKQRGREWCIWAVTCLLAVGTIPTNLAGLAAVVLYVLPLYGETFYRKKQFWLLALTPLAMLFCFYFPIAPAFLQCCQLGEACGVAGCHAAGIGGVCCAAAAGGCGGMDRGPAPRIPAGLFCPGAYLAPAAGCLFDSAGGAVPQNVFSDVAGFCGIAGILHPAFCGGTVRVDKAAFRKDFCSAAGACGFFVVDHDGFSGIPERFFRPERRRGWG